MTHSSEMDHERRNFLYIATSGFGAVGAAMVAVPFIDQMNPDATTRASASLEVDISSVEPGQSITVLWQSQPVFIRHRTEREIEAARAVDYTTLIDPVEDKDRVIEGREQWLIVIGICTHLNCIPLGYQGNYDGWLCACHGSEYDTAGRVRKGPAPTNLALPPVTFVSDSIVRLG